MRPKGSAEVLEARRRRAMKLLDGGKLNQRQVADRVGCSPSAVSRWASARARGGAQALKVKPTPGRPPKLTSKQKQKLIKLLQRGPLALGYHTELWTTARIADLIAKQFKVRYHRDHVGRLMHALGWSTQVPQRRARQRDEGSVEQWRRSGWQRVKKSPKGWEPTSSS